MSASPQILVTSPTANLYADPGEGTFVVVPKGTVLQPASFSGGKYDTKLHGGKTWVQVVAPKGTRLWAAAAQTKQPKTLETQKAVVLWASVADLSIPFYGLPGDRIEGRVERPLPLPLPPPPPVVEAGWPWWVAGLIILTSWGLKIGFTHAAIRGRPGR